MNPRSMEWVKLTCSQLDLEHMVIDGVLPDQATAGGVLQQVSTS